MTRLSILRPQDLLVLDFELINLQAAADGAALVPQDAAADSFVIVHFPPQALAEAVWTGPVDAPPIRTVLAGPSRLAFRIPSNVVLPLTTEGLLAWEGWEPVLAPTALPRGTLPDAAIPLPALPTATQTAIEFPWRLVLSPDPTGRWRTDNSPAASEPRQLWSAVLHTTPDGAAPDAVDRGTVAGADVRAIAEFTGPQPQHLVTSLDALPKTREQIVQLSSNFHLPIPEEAGLTRFTPVPLQARRLELTALGANAELDVGWNYPLIPAEVQEQLPGYIPIGLVQYQHTAALGRDHFVRTVKVGYVCGTGHRAVVVATAERLPAGLEVVGHTASGAGLFGAKGYLLLTVDVFVQQPVVDYEPLADAFAHDGRELPLKRIRITTLSARITPPSVEEGKRPFWLRDPARNKLMFHAVGTDIADNTVEFSLPLMFVWFENLGDHRLIRAVFDGLFDHDLADTHTFALGGQAVTFAPAGDKPGATVLKTASVTYDIEQPPHDADLHPTHPMNAAGAPASYIPRFLPRVASLMASAPAVDDLLGTAQPQEMVPDPVYLARGFDPAFNRAQAFVGFVQDLPLALPTQRGGGLASPTSAAQALSRSLGPISAPDKLQGGEVDLSAFSNTKILGTIPLLKLLRPDPPFDAAATGAPVTQAQLDDPTFFVNPPRLTTRRLPEGAAVPESVETRFIWKPQLLESQEVESVLKLDMEHADLLLDSTTRLVRGGESSSVVVGRLRNIKLKFADALSAQIDSLYFRAESGRKIEAGASGVRIVFEGPLAFVNTLQSILPADGFDDPPFLTVDSQGVVAGYTLGVPSVGVGIFSIQNIALSAALSIPFTDRPAGVRFAVSERHKPFLITVSLFGGGGFFGVAVSAKGLEEVEASLEFGGNISLNLGIASGGVSVMAGIYFGMKGDSVELTGYLRCGGYLEVLGLISISLEFYLAFTYRKKGDIRSEVWGQASLSVSVKIAFFSTSVTLSVERRFAGAGGDPSFAESVAPGAWASYLQAFA
jgi:hypothetical protein